MSGFLKISPEDICLMSSMRHATALVWMRLMLYGGKDGKAWPKQKALCDELNLSKAAVARAYSDLKKRGLLKIVQRRAHSMCIKVSRVAQNDNSQDKRVIQNDNAEVSQSRTDMSHSVEQTCPQNDICIVIDKVKEKVINKVIGDEQKKPENNRDNFLSSEGANEFAFKEEKHLWVYEFIKKWKTNQWLSNNLKGDIKQICWSASPLQTQKAIHKMDVWMSKQKSADVWSGRSWYRRMALWIHEEPEIITERDKYRMKGSTIKISSFQRNESEKKKPAPKPVEQKEFVANTRARKIWSEFLKHKDYEARYHAVQSWVRGTAIDAQLRSQIDADKALEEFAFMIG